MKQEMQEIALGIGKVWGMNLAILSVIHFTDLETILKCVLLVVGIGYAVWKWYSEWRASVGKPVVSKAVSKVVDDASKLLVVSMCVVSLAGCTFFARNKDKVDTKIEERAREYTDAALKANRIGQKHLSSAKQVSITLPETPTSKILGTNLHKATEAYDLSGDYLGKDQGLIGLPNADQALLVDALLSDNRAIRSKAEATEKIRTEETQQWVTERRALEEKLLDMGKQLEAERNQNVVKRVFRSIFATLGIGGIICLFIFFPPALVIALKFLGWILDKVPAVAHYVGVMSTNFADRTIKSVEKAKANLQNKNSSKTEIDLIDAAFREEMHGDADKTFVRIRKAKLAAQNKLPKV